MTNIEKHKYGVSLVSNHLSEIMINHEIIDSESTHDIEITYSGNRIKIFSNFAKNSSIKVNKTFETEEGVLYLVVSPTDKNNIGYTCVGGYGDTIRNSMKSFTTPDSPKNIEVNKLGFINIMKRISN